MTRKTINFRKPFSQLQDGMINNASEWLNGRIIWNLGDGIAQSLIVVDIDKVYLGLLMVFRLPSVYWLHG